MAIIEVYATQVEQDKYGWPDPVAVLGHPVAWNLEPVSGAVKVSLYVADNSRVWQEKGFVWIDEGNGPGILRTYNCMPSLSIHTYYGDINKPLRIMSVGR